MRAPEEKILIDGPAGKIEVIVENPGAPKGIALVCHPHPLFGGANSVGREIKASGATFRVIGVLDEWRPAPKFYDMTQDRFTEVEQLFGGPFAANDARRAAAGA